MSNETEEIEFEELIEKLDDNPSFAKAKTDPRLLDLQKEVVEFVTSVILNHELEFYRLVQKMFPSKLENLLCHTGPSIIQMITEVTNKFYNKIYFDIQHKNDTPLVKLILKMCELTDYGPHVLLDKLLRLTIELHLDVDREKLDIMDLARNIYSISNRPLDSKELDSSPEDFYQKSVLRQINNGLKFKNLVHIFCKGVDEDMEFVHVPEGKCAFEIVIDKNIGEPMKD